MPLFVTLLYMDQFVKFGDTQKNRASRSCNTWKIRSGDRDTVFENYEKSLIYASEASNSNFLKTFGFPFLPLTDSFGFLQILGFYSVKRITKNQKEFSRGKRVSPKVSKVTTKVGIFKHSASGYCLYVCQVLLGL